MHKLIQQLIPNFFSIYGRIAPQSAARMAWKMFITPPKVSRGPRDAEFWASGQKLSLPSQLDVRSFGNSQNQSVWVVHGWGSRSSHLRNIIEALVSHNYHVIAWDGPAHGQNPQHTTNLYEFSHLLHNDILSAKQNEFFLIGHSFGGASAAYISAQNPKIKKLVTIASPTDVKEIFLDFWQQIHLPQKAHTIFLSLSQKILKDIPLRQLSMVHFYQQIEVPWLLLHDWEDMEVKITGTQHFQSMPSTTQEVRSFYFTKGLGHHKILKSEEIIQQILNFLS